MISIRKFLFWSHFVAESVWTGLESGNTADGEGDAVKVSVHTVHVSLWTECWRTQISHGKQKNSILQKSILIKVKKKNHRFWIKTFPRIKELYTCSQSPDLSGFSTAWSQFEATPHFLQQVVSSFFSCVNISEAQKIFSVKTINLMSVCTNELSKDVSYSCSDMDTGSFKLVVSCETQIFWKKDVDAALF